MTRLTPEREQQILKTLENKLNCNSLVGWTTITVETLLAEIDALREEKETWGNEFIAVYVLKSERDFLQKELDKANDRTERGQVWNEMVELQHELKRTRELLEECAEAFGHIERAYPLDGQRMAHQDYAANMLAKLRSVSPQGEKP